MSIEITTLFELNILSGFLKEVDNQKILNQISNKNKRLSENEIESNYEDYEISFSTEIKKISDGIKLDYERVTNNQESLEIIGHWAHIHEYNESCNMHCHMSAQDVVHGPHLSAVYYVQIPENSGKLVFDFNTSKYERDRYSVTPIDNKYVLFPSYLDHFVTKNQSKEKRISISFNYRKIKL